MIEDFARGMERRKLISKKSVCRLIDDFRPKAGPEKTPLKQSKKYKINSYVIEGTVEKNEYLSHENGFAKDFAVLRNKLFSKT